MHRTTNLGDSAISPIEQPAHLPDSRVQSSNILFLPGFSPTEARLPSQHKLFIETLKRANPDISPTELRVITGTLYQTVFGHTADELRRIFRVPAPASLRKVLAIKSPYYFSYLKMAETHARCSIESMIIEGKFGNPILSHILHHRVGRIGEAVGKMARDFVTVHLNSETHSPSLRFDIMTGTWLHVGIPEIDETDEDEDEKEFPF